MNYEIHENLVSEDILFIHGNLANNLWWQPTLRSFRASAKRGPGRLILAEWRGCGKSSAARHLDQLHPESLARDYLSLLDDLQIEQAHIVGHSAGGLISLACLWLDPSRFHRAVLLDPVSVRGLEIDESKKEAFVAMSENRSLLEAALLGAVEGARSQDSEFQSWVDAASKVAKINWLGVLDQFSDIDFRSRLKDVDQSVLVLHGDKDLVLPEEGSREIAELLPLGKFYQLKGQGHSCNVEDPQRFHRLLIEFLFPFD